MTSLSTKIADLRDLVTLTSSYSPFAPTVPQRAAASPPLPDHVYLSPGSSHLSANARSFTRTASAPASSSFFQSPHFRKGSNNRPSGTFRRGGLLSSPTLTETSEDGEDHRPPESGRLLASLSLPEPTPTARLTSDGTTRTFGRSKTGALALTPNYASSSGQLAARDIGIYAGQNALTS